MEPSSPLGGRLHHFATHVQARSAHGRRASMMSRVALGSTGFPGAGGPGRPRDLASSLRSAPRLEARPSPPAPPAPSTPAMPGLLTCGWARRLEARPGPAAAHGHRSQTLRPLRRSSSWWCLVYSAISHVIPSQLVQTLNSPRWDCNVFGWSRKVTVGNYVRNLFGCVLAAAHRHRGEVLRPLRRASHLWGQECCCVGSLDLCLAFGTQFALLGFLVVRTVHNSPCLASWW